MNQTAEQQAGVRIATRQSARQIKVEQTAARVTLRKAAHQARKTLLLSTKELKKAVAAEAKRQRDVINNDHDTENGLLRTELSAAVVKSDMDVIARYHEKFSALAASDQIAQRIAAVDVRGADAVSL